MPFVGILLSMFKTGDAFDFKKIFRVLEVLAVAIAIFWLAHKVFALVDEYGQLKTDHIKDQVQIQSFQNNLKDMQANVEKQKVAFDTINTTLQQHANTLNKFRARFSLKELTEMGLANPVQLSQKLQQEGTNRLRCLEILTGQQQTDAEVQSKFVETVCK